MRIVSIRPRAERDTMSLTDPFAHVADALADGGFELVDDVDEHTLGDVIAFPTRLRLVNDSTSVRVDGSMPTPPWGGAA